MSLRTLFINHKACAACLLLLFFKLYFDLLFLVFSFYMMFEFYFVMDLCEEILDSIGNEKSFKI